MGMLRAGAGHRRRLPRRPAPPAPGRRDGAPLRRRQPRPGLHRLRGRPVRRRQPGRARRGRPRPATRRAVRLLDLAPRALGLPRRPGRAGARRPRRRTSTARRTSRARPASSPTPSTTARSATSSARSTRRASSSSTSSSPSGPSATRRRGEGGHRCAGRCSRGPRSSSATGPADLTGHGPVVPSSAVPGLPQSACTVPPRLRPAGIGCPGADRSSATCRSEEERRWRRTSRPVASPRTSLHAWTACPGRDGTGSSSSGSGRCGSSTGSRSPSSGRCRRP